MKAKHFILGALVVAAPAFAQGSDTTGAPAGSTGSSMGSAGSSGSTEQQMDPSHSQMGSQPSTGGSGSASAMLPKADQDVIKDLHKLNREEIELGRVAAQKGQSDDVKKFGQMIVDDHTQADQKVSALATQHGIMLDEAAVEKDAQKAADKLNKKSAKSFDRDYIGMMVKDHEKDVSKVQKAEAKAGEELKPVLTELLPTLQKHLDEARRIHMEIKGSKASARTPSTSRPSNQR